MIVKNTSTEYGIISKCLHWLVAIIVIGLFSSGLWMVELGYYDRWYQLAPHYHKSAGLLLCAVIICRIGWRYYAGQPLPLVSHSTLEKYAAHYTHRLLYGTLLLLFVSGYLISTADNRGIEVFNWFTAPSIGGLFDNQEDISGEVHEWLAFFLIGMVVLHSVAALKHRVIDKDNTLKRML